MSSAKRGEVWLVDLNPTRGQEIRKTRLVVIISSDLFDPIPLRITIPITTWQEKFNDRPFMVRIDACADNGLDRDSAGNVLQIRSLSTDRFVKRLGQVSEEILQELLAGLVVCTDYAPKL
jgi:mRNA interferase MazF